MKLKTLIATRGGRAARSPVFTGPHRPPARPAAAARGGRPLLAKSVVLKAARVEVSDQGKQVVLVRRPDGTWRVPGYFDLPVDFSKLSGMISDLTSAKIDRFVTSDPVVMARLEFKDTAIKLLGDHGQVLWWVVLGKTPDTGGQFVRFGDEPKAYLSDLNTFIDSDPKNWADPSILNLKPAAIAKVEVPFGTGKPIVLSRAKPDAAWTADHTPAGERVKADTLSSLLSSLGQLRFSDTSALGDPAVAAARRHERTFRLTTFAGLTYTVALGRKPEEKKLEPAKPAAAVPKKTAAKPAKPAAPKYESVPAGPVYAFISCSDAHAPINALMGRRAFQVDTYTFTGLPQQPSDLFEPAPPPAAAAKPKTP